MNTPETSKELHSLAIKIYNMINHLQRINQFVKIEYDNIKLSRIELFLLIELEAELDADISYFQKIIRVDRSTISRNLSSLLEKNLINLKTQNKSRTKKFIISNKGFLLLKKVDLRANSIFNEKKKILGQRKINYIIELFEIISSFLNQPKNKKRDSDPYFRVAQRRLTMALGLLNEKAYESDLSHLALQTLLLIKEHEGSNTSKISNELKVDIRTLTVVINNLCKNGFVVKKKQVYDSRNTALCLTKKSIKLLAEIELRVSKKLSSAISLSSISKLKSMIKSLEEYALANMPAAKKIELKQLSKISQRTEARSFFISCLVKMGKEEICPEILFSEDRQCFGYYIDNQLVGVRQLFKDQVEIDFKLANSHYAHTKL